MNLNQYIKSKNLTLDDLRKAFMITTHTEAPRVFFDENKARSAIAKLLYSHFCTVVNFPSCESTDIFRTVAEYVHENEKNENAYIDTMPMLIAINDDILNLFSDDDEAMEFYSTSEYEVIL